MHTDINVVIPAFKPDEKLINIFRMLKKQTVPVSKVIVMNTKDGEDTGDVFSLADKYGYDIDDGFIEVHDIEKKDFDHGKTRNLGASYANNGCEYIVFMTQDAQPYDTHLTEELLKPFNNDSVGISYAKQLADEKSSLAERFTRNFNYPDEDRLKTVDDINTLGIKAFFCSNVCAMYKKPVFDKLGGFVNEAIFNEDMVFANKLLKSGYDIYYASGAKVIHTHEYSGKQQFKRNFDLAVSQKMNPQAFLGISSESEGIKYVKEAFKFFCKYKKPYLIIPFGVNCVYKYMGYRAGKNYDRMSHEKILKYTANKDFFENKGTVK